QVSPQPERVQALRDLLSEAIDPNTLALLTPGAEGMEIIELDQATAEAEQALAEPHSVEPFAEAESVEDAGEAPQAEDESAAAYADLDEEMVEIFLEEAVDILESAAQALERWLGEPDNTLPLSALQRDLHTLKGGARMAAIRPIGDLGHELESLYEGLVDRRYSHSPALGTLLQQSHDRLAQMLDQLQARQTLASADELILAIRQFRHGGAPHSLSAAVAHVEPAPESPLSELPEPEVERIELPPLALVEDEIVFDEVPEPEAQSPTVESVEPPLPQALPAVDETLPEPQSMTLANWHDERDPELVEIFLEEGFDIIDSAGAALQRWMANVDNSIELEALQRDLHTLKGGARMAEIREIGDLAHELEFLYEDLGAGRLRASPELFGLLQACHDRLAEMLDAVRGQRVVPQGTALIETIKRFRGNPNEQLSIPQAVQLKAVVDSDAAEEADSDILDIFLEEGDDLLEAMEAVIGRFETQRDDVSAIEEMQRILHTLKGGARLAGQKRLGDLSHDLEQHLTEALQQGAPWPESLFLDVQSGFEGLQQELDLLRQRLSASLAGQE
ncbi:MAG: hybrid sensor histidine kinase/response regulator, partial [Ectopseudomonas oleovorans]